MTDWLWFLMGFGVGLTVWEIGHYVAIYLAKQAIEKIKKEIGK